MLRRDVEMPARGFRRVWYLVAAGLLSMVWLILSACGGGETLPDVRLSQASPRRPANPYQAGDQVLRVAVAPVNSPRETLNLYQGLVAYLGRRLGRPTELLQGKTYAEINDLIRAGDVTLALVCTNAYLEGQADFGMEALAVPQVAGETVYFSYLIVPQDSLVNSLADLRGRTFAFSDPLSNSGRLVVVYRLQQMDERPETFFQRHIFTYSHDNSIKAVAQKLVEGAAVDSLVYDDLAIKDPELIARTRIIARWGPYGINPLVVHPRLEAELKTRLRELLLTLHEDPEGQTLLAQLRVDRFVLPDETAYDSVRAMRAAVRRSQR